MRDIARRKGSSSPSSSLPAADIRTDNVCISKYIPAAIDQPAHAALCGSTLGICLCFTTCPHNFVITPEDGAYTAHSMCQSGSICFYQTGEQVKYNRIQHSAPFAGGLSECMSSIVSRIGCCCRGVAVPPPPLDLSAPWLPPPPRPSALRRLPSAEADSCPVAVGTSDSDASEDMLPVRIAGRGGSAPRPGGECRTIAAGVSATRLPRRPGAGCTQSE